MGGGARGRAGPVPDRHGMSINRQAAADIHCIGRVFEIAWKIVMLESML